MRLDLSKMLSAKNNSQVNVASGDVFEEMYELPNDAEKKNSDSMQMKTKGKRTVYIRKWNPEWNHMATSVPDNQLRLN